MIHRVAYSFQQYVQDTQNNSYLQGLWAKTGSVANFRGGSTFLQNQAQAGCSLCAESLILGAADDLEGVDGPDNVHPVTCVWDSPGRILQKLPRLPFKTSTLAVKVHRDAGNCGKTGTSMHSGTTRCREWRCFGHVDALDRRAAAVPEPVEGRRPSDKLRKCPSQ